MRLARCCHAYRDLVHSTEKPGDPRPPARRGGRSPCAPCCTPGVQLSRSCTGTTVPQRCARETPPTAHSAPVDPVSRAEAEFEAYTGQLGVCGGARNARGKNAVGDAALRVAGHFNGAVRGLPRSDPAMCGSPGAAMHIATSFTPRRNQAIPGLLHTVQGVALVRPAAHHLQSASAGEQSRRRARCCNCPWSRRVAAQALSCASTGAPAWPDAADFPSDPERKPSQRIPSVANGPPTQLPSPQPPSAAGCCWCGCYCFGSCCTGPDCCCCWACS